ncbi:hypothetical protein AVEN_76248-1 [Araneus ventricosus]|uniref:Uncharacterized protein n=1 Tax=Araneus ventricosus TaxID=182803 RepID=A0A4Y2GM80_ARAVE|nr:hypothetical protein AVEN_76248-1 [Araneus ventricosus]
MRGSVKDRLNEYLDFYDSVFEKHEMWRVPDGVKFDERSGLGNDVHAMVQRCLKRYIRWYHVMLKHDGFETFVREMSKISKSFVCLPFWCLCDGLKDKAGRRHRHRHMVMACELESSFEKVWKEKVMYEFQKEKGANIKLMVRIKTVFHLIRKIVYVSRQKASCNRGIPDGDDLERTLSHFCINRPVCEHAVGFLCTLFPGGIEELLLEQNKNKNVIVWERFVVRVRDGEGCHKKWVVPIGKTSWKFQNCVIPVEKQYEPTDEETDFYLHLYGDERLYFKVNEQLSALSNDEWYAYQPARATRSDRSERNCTCCRPSSKT